jgi:ubiquinone/menaquinone biosynthesis C-methylase UbiE
MLRSRAPHVTALELDAKLASRLRAKFSGTGNVEVVTGDCCAMPFSDGRFSAVACFTMLHHLASAEMQDRMLREAWRVLKPGGVFVGCDSRQSWRLRLIHIGDTLTPVDPDGFGARLEAAGFRVHAIEKNAEVFRFHGTRRPSDGASRGIC